MKIQLPSISRQIQVADILDDIDADIKNFHSRLLKAKKIKAGMMQELLTGRTRLL